MKLIGLLPFRFIVDVQISYGVLSWDGVPSVPFCFTKCSSRYEAMDVLGVYFVGCNTVHEQSGHNLKSVSLVSSIRAYAQIYVTSKIVMGKAKGRAPIPRPWPYELAVFGNFSVLAFHPDEYIGCGRRRRSHQIFINQVMLDFTEVK